MSMVFKALSDPTRRHVLELLRKRPMSAGELADHFDVSKPTMSAHFAVLREAGLIASEKHGKSVVYELQLSVLEDAILGFAQAFGWKWQNGAGSGTKTGGKAANRTKSTRTDNEVFER
jgi:DNA-binding transcriptional ArsR family regulator